jgi:multidrug resistance efflux pump
MSEEKNAEAAATPEPVAPKPAGPASKPAESDAGRSVKIGGLSVLVIIVLSLTWYLLADRHTPYTRQARVEAYVVGVAPKVGGLVTQVWVKNDEMVDEDQPLFEIDPSQYQIALDQARSGLDNAVNQVGAGDAAVDAARAQYRAAVANLDRAEKDTARQEKMYEEDPGTISVRRLESSQASVDMARAQVAAAEAAIQGAIEQKGGNDETTNAILESARSAVEKAELDLSNTVVKASTPGRISDLRAEIGQFAGTGQPVLTLIAISDVWINAEFTENNLGNLEVGTPVRILFDSLPGRIFKGEIRSIGIGVNSGTASAPGTLPTIQNDRDWLRQSQRFPVVIEFDPGQSEELERQLRAGGQASVMAFTNERGILNLLGRIYLRLMSWFSYVY